MTLRRFHQQSCLLAVFAFFHCIVCPAMTYAALFYFECNSAPTADGWTLFQAYCAPTEFVENGWLVHSVGACETSPPPGGQQLDYQRSLEPFENAPTFFLECRVQSDGDRSELPWGGPAKVALASFGPVNYRLSISRDLIELNRNNLLPVIQKEVDPARPHTLRIELPDAATYRWYVDGELIDAGVSEGLYPADEPFIAFRSKSAFLPSTNRWDYIRYGTIPTEGSGDFDSNGMVDSNDVYFFLDCLLGPDSAGPGCRWADMNHDGATNAADIQQFAAALING